MQLDGKNLTTEQLTRIARGEKIAIAPSCKEKMNKSRAFVEKMFQEKKPAYGTTTGIGELASVILSPEDARQFSKKLIYSHAGGYGVPVSKEVARAAIAARINVLAKGVSGVRPAVADFIAEMLNEGVTPIMYPASVGACGDLAPMAQAMLVPIGEGEANYEGERMSGADALKKAGLKPITYEIRDGLAVINGSQLTTGLAALEIEDAKLLLKSAEIAAALSSEALKAVKNAFDDEILQLRGFRGGIECAENLRKLLRGSTILGEPARIQDAYSIRSTPQVLGTVKDAIRYVEDQVTIELNAGADNPLFVPKNTAEGGRYLAGANFQGTPIALPLEMLGQGVSTIAVLSERRLNRLLNPVLNEGLPGFLIEKAGLNSGIMIPQYTAASLVNQCRVYCTPAAIGSIPTAADQEDFVSMGTNTALKTWGIIDKAFAVVAIECLAAAQAAELRMKQEKKNLATGTRAAFNAIRELVPFLAEDRPLYPDIERLVKLLKSGELVRAVEKAVGELG